MNISGISSNYHQSVGANNKSTKTATGTGFTNYINNAAGNAGKGHIVYMKTDDMLYSGGNGTGLSFYLKYAEDSTEDDPTVIAQGVDENGDKFEQTIHINDINPKNATIVEMRALEAYTGVKKQYGFTSLPLSSGNMGLHERRNFMAMFEKTISDMTILRQQSTAAYYRYSMQAYWDFMSKK